MSCFFAAPHSIAIVMVYNSASLIKSLFHSYPSGKIARVKQRRRFALPFAGHQQLQHVYTTAFRADGYLQQGLLHVAAECWQQQQLEAL
jgi:hypothetical protein